MVSTLNSTQLRFRLKTKGTTSTLVTGYGEITTGQWYHIAAVYYGSNMSIYKNGVQAASTAKTGSISNGNASVALGNQPLNAGSRAFDGLLDEVCLYDKALSAAEISYIMTNGCVSSGNPTPTNTSTATPTNTPLPNATATASPTPTATASSTPPPTNEVTKIQRTYYSIAGQAVGVRVKKILDNGSTESDKLYYMYTDHLGNVGALSDKNGNYVSGSLTLFRPFGDFRRTPSTNPDITDRGYTGHAHNNSGDNDLGLIYMRARFYLPEAARFISADPIVPDPMNPQQFNRYTYGLNNPIRYSDPTGHCGAEGNNIASWSWNSTDMKYVPTYSATYQQCIDIRDQLQDQYGWEIIGEWYLADVQTLAGAAQAIGGWFRNGGSLNPQEVIRQTLGGTIFKYADPLSPFRLGEGYHHVEGQVVSMIEHFSLRGIVHELGHVFDNNISGKTGFGGSAVWGGGLSDQFASFVGMSGYEGCILRFKCNGSYSGSAWDDDSQSNRPGTGIYWKNGSSEDFAQAFRSSVLEPQYLQSQSPSRAQFLNLIRGGIVDFND